MLNDHERKILERLAAYRLGELCELGGDDAQRERAWTKCQNLEARGYVKTADRARCGFELIPGQFVRITEAGRAALA